MMVMMDSGEWKSRDSHRLRSTRRRGACRLRLPTRSLFLGLSLLVLLSGCGKKALEEAQQEAREAKTTVQQLKHSLGLAEREIANMKAEFNVVRIRRDELQEEVKRANQERDEALALVQQAQEAMKIQSSGQASATAALQQRVNELIGFVAEQQKVIEGLTKQTTAESPTVPPAQPTPVEPNEGL